MTFEFTCDARVTRRIEAYNRQNARKQWEKFRKDVDSSTHFQGCYPALGTFHLALLDSEPEVEQVK